MKEFLYVVVLISLQPFVHAAEDGHILFENEVRPALKNHCFDCHGSRLQEGGLRLDNREDFIKGGRSGNPLAISKSGLTLLQIYLTENRTSKLIHPTIKIPEKVVQHIEQWISIGAPWPEYDSEHLNENEWWALKPVTNVEIPKVKNRDWPTNEIDYFILNKLEESGLEPAKRSESTKLIRRLYFDLTGLPPEPDRIKNLPSRLSQQNWKLWVDDLLARPAYGERWAQHWLDVVRWGESDGYRADEFRPDAWPYRDFVINSFNHDKPYNQFIREQLAGDEISPDNPDVLIGTAFLRNGIYEWNQRDVRMHWDLIVNEVTDLTGEVFLGLGLRCARCHDHKFDPIKQEDYFRFRALLGTIRWNHDLKLASKQEIKNFQKQDLIWKKKTKDLRDKLNAIIEPVILKKENAALIKFPEDIKEMFSKEKAQRSPYEQQLVELAAFQLSRERKMFKPESISGENGKKIKTILEKLKAFDHLKPKPLRKAFVATDIGDTAPNSYLTSRRGKKLIPPGFLSALSSEHLSPEQIKKVNTNTS